jgi:hypothetical protein
MAIDTTHQNDIQRRIDRRSKTLIEQEFGDRVADAEFLV